MSFDYYLCNKQTRQILSVGPIPDTYKRITGMADLPYEIVRDLSWAGEGYSDVGFLTEKDAFDLGVDPNTLRAYATKAKDVQWQKIKEERDAKIESIRWRVERHEDHIRLGRLGDEDIMGVLTYIQALRDLPSVQVDPYDIKWPSLEEFILTNRIY